QDTIHLLGDDEGDAARTLQQLARGQDTELMRPDAGIAGDDFEDARDLGRGDSEETGSDLQHTEYHQRLGHSAPESLAVLLIMRRRAPDADHLPDGQGNNREPDHEQRDQPDPRLSL